MKSMSGEMRTTFTNKPEKGVPTFMGVTGSGTIEGEPATKVQLVFRQGESYPVWNTLDLDPSDAIIFAQEIISRATKVQEGRG